MRKILEAAVDLTVRRGPRKHTMLQVLGWLVRRMQTRTSSR